MTANEAKKLSYDNVSKEIVIITEQIKDACKKGLLEIRVNQLTPACQSMLEDRGYYVDTMSIMNVVVYTISWENAKD